MNSTVCTETVALVGHGVIHLASDLGMTSLVIEPDAWAHVSTDWIEFTEGRIVTVFDYDSTWTYSERHAGGEELVFLIHGDVRFRLEDDSGRREVVLRPGHATVVPRGTWHQALVQAPSRVLFITPTPALTEHRPADLR